jgi:hypothetical protein
LTSALLSAVIFVGRVWEFACPLPVLLMSLSYQPLRLARVSLCFLVLACCASGRGLDAAQQTPSAAPASEEEVTMHPLRIRLEEFFDDDLVVVEANGREVFRQEGLTTNFSVGIAHVATVHVSGPQVEVKVTVPSRGASGIKSFDLTRFPILQVRLPKGSKDVLLTPLDEEPQVY